MEKTTQGGYLSQIMEMTPNNRKSKFLSLIPIINSYHLSFHFKEVGINIDLEKFLNGNLNYNEIYTTFKNAQQGILSLIEKLPKPVQDPEEKVWKDYYGRMGENRAVQITKNKIMYKKWRRYVVIVQADLCGYSNYDEDEGSVALGILKENFERYCKNHNGKFINQAGDAFVVIFGAYDKALEFANSLKSYLKKYSTYIEKPAPDRLRSLMSNL